MCLLIPSVLVVVRSPVWCTNGSTAYESRPPTSCFILGCLRRCDFLVLPYRAHVEQGSDTVETCRSVFQISVSMLVDPELNLVPEGAGEHYQRTLTLDRLASTTRSGQDGLLFLLESFPWTVEILAGSRSSMAIKHCYLPSSKTEQTVQPDRAQYRR